MQDLEEGQIVLCTVEKIVGTIVFVKIEEYNSDGTITFSEISPGRIRNIRDYVVPGKKIVCKILKLTNHGIYLSLRRVKLKEKNEFNEELRKEKSSKAILKTILGEDSEKIINKIKEDHESIIDFLEEAKEDKKLLEKYISKTDGEKIIKILEEKKQKDIVLTRTIKLSSKANDGILLIKEIVKKATKDCPDCKVSYLAAGKYLIKVKTQNPKKTDQELDKVIANIEELAKEKDCEFNELK